MECMSGVCSCRDGQIDCGGECRDLCECPSGYVECDGQCVGRDECCNGTALAPGNTCCPDGTQAESCCGGTALEAGNMCCDNVTGLQGPSCGACTTDAACDDGDTCTHDWCLDGTCRYDAVPSTVYRIPEGWVSCETTQSQSDSCDMHTIPPTTIHTTDEIQLALPASLILEKDCLGKWIPQSNSGWILTESGMLTYTFSEAGPGCSGSYSESFNMESGSYSSHGDSACTFFDNFGCSIGTSYSSACTGTLAVCDINSPNCE